MLPRLSPVYMIPLSGAQSQSLSFFLIKTWENMAAISQYNKVHDALIEGLDNLTKWYKKTDDSTTYFICLGMIHKNDVFKLMSLLNPSALDSNVKVAYAQHHWGDDSFNAVLKMLEEVVSFI